MEGIKPPNLAEVDKKYDRRNSTLTAAVHNARVKYLRDFTTGGSSMTF
jgi:hypothetical protein